MSNNQMTKTEEIRLHNLFIKFKNEGKGIDEIKGLLEVDGDVLDGWDGNFEKENENLRKEPTPFEINIVGIDNNGQYVFDNHLAFEMSQLQKVKFDLIRSINTIEEGKEEHFFQSNSKKYLPIFEQYFIDLTIKYTDDLNFSSKSKLNTNDENIKVLAQEAISFYVTLSKGEKKYLDSILIQQPSTDIYLNAKKILPYSLKTLKIKNYEDIKLSGIEGLPIDTNWIFLIGENGFGKTTILRSISIGFIGKKDEEAELFHSDFQINGIGIEYFSLSTSLINNVGRIEFPPFAHLACYGPSRLQIQTDQTQNDIAKKSTTTYSLFNSDGILLNIEFELLIWHLEKNPRFDAVKQTFLKLIPYLYDIQVDVPQRKIFYIEKEPTENGSKYNSVTFNQLASGFRSILAMVGDMMIRLFKSQPEITEPSELAGIVIIDELDLHWHPKMQREIPSLLSSIFPKVQFIASTHSLVPLLGAPENSVLLKVNRTVEEGITVEKVEIDFQALSSDTMLRDIFDLEEYMSDPKIKAWERYTKLKGLIHFEKDEAMKNEYIHEREILGDKYNFTL
jgi:AAA domain, putative AbiEii toxin, Type IV TA system